MASSLASAVRAYASERGLTVGSKGRLSTDLFVDYLVAHPRTAREVAATVGVTVSARGRLSDVTARQIAEAVR